MRATKPLAAFILGMLSVSAVVIGLLAFPAIRSLADHQAGATYVGAHDEKGPVTVQVAADGTYVQSFQANNIALDLSGDCPGTINVNFTNMPISDFLHLYGRSEIVDGVEVDLFGDFTIPGFTTGIVSVDPDGDGGCINLVFFAAAPGAAPTGIQGDVNCDGQVNIVDSLGVLKYSIGLPASQNEPCRDMGT